MGFNIDILLCFIPILREFLFPIRVSVKQIVAGGTVSRTDYGKFVLEKVSNETKQKTKKIKLAMFGKTVDIDENITLKKAMFPFELSAGWEAEYCLIDETFIPIKTNLIVNYDDKTITVNGDKIIKTGRQTSTAIEKVNNIVKSVEGERDKDPLKKFIIIGFIMLGVLFVVGVFIIYSFETQSDNFFTRLAEDLPNTITNAIKEGLGVTETIGEYGDVYQNVTSPVIT